MDFAGAMVASHSLFVGRRQSPGADASFNWHWPSFRPATAFLASSQVAVDKQLGSFSQMSPVTVSVTVPFPQSTYRIVLSVAHAPEAAGETRGDPSAGLAGVTR